MLQGEWWLQSLEQGTPRKTRCVWRNSESDFRAGEFEVPLRYSTGNIKKEVEPQRKTLNRGKKLSYCHVGSK